MKKIIIFAAFFVAVALFVASCVATKFAAGCGENGCYIQADSISVLENVRP